MEPLRHLEFAFFFSNNCYQRLLTSTLTCINVGFKAVGLLPFASSSSCLSSCYSSSSSSSWSPAPPPAVIKIINLIITLFIINGHVEGFC
eukprot:3158233-Karenia_brevis.AAC.1